MEDVSYIQQYGVFSLTFEGQGRSYMRSVVEKELKYNKGTIMMSLIDRNIYLKDY
jgi:hypothetical protein